MQVDIYVPKHARRTQQTFRIRSSRTYASELSAIQRGQILYNEIVRKHPDIDIFFLNRDQFRKKLIALL
jgi:hypothetical protein